MNDKIQASSSDLEAEAKWESEGLAQGHAESVLGRTPASRSGSFWVHCPPSLPSENPLPAFLLLLDSRCAYPNLPRDLPVALTDPWLRVREIKLAKDKHYFQSALQD